ncbi:MULTISPECIES: hypothetical protein [Prauserella salsuginis group]|uniref:Uncharacterized protein n=2 Tax=Prauserella salsuginis group TaxID=2893672 RepID=A0A839Y132_9PSEU|nr:MULTISPECIES: hypothetical protein [Prauserella salsuginis group]MBB3666403.1 hypothetical protein [Prauserella sediminis]MCR3719141.1 hypothetical protein [Prauserella flava]MCR3735846.1 hypothetical protein [Prauserella salsuginis]
MTYIVKAGYVTAQTKVGKGRAYIDIPRGARLPDDVSAEEIDWLLRSGQIAADDGPADETAEPAGAPDDADDGADEVSLEDTDKDGLVALAESEGVDIDKRWTAARIAEAIRDHRNNK